MKGKRTFALPLANASLPPAKRACTTSAPVAIPSTSSHSKTPSSFVNRFDRNVLRRFLNPSALSEDGAVLCLEETRFSLVKDKYPKARVHLLVVVHEEFISAPTVKSLSAPDLNNLREIHDFIRGICSEIESNKESIEKPLLTDNVREELHNSLRSSHFRVGFHAKPSLYPLHIHIISDDMDSVAMKNKKHWNSFTSEFFVPINRVIDILEANGSCEEKLPSDDELEELLKKDLVCHKCMQGFSNIPQLKRHLQNEH